MHDAQHYARTLCTTLYEAYSAVPHPSPFYLCARLLGVLPPCALTPPPRPPPAPSVHARTGTRAPCKHFAQQFACIVHYMHLARFTFWVISCITHDIVPLDILLPGASLGQHAAATRRRHSPRTSCCRGWPVQMSRGARPWQAPAAPRPGFHCTPHGAWSPGGIHQRYLQENEKNRHSD